MRAFDHKAKYAQLQQLAEDVLAEAGRQGASSAEVAAHSDMGLSATVRLGEPETIEHTRDNSLSISVYMGQHKGSASTAELSTAAIHEAVSAACSIAKQTAEDPCAGLADAELMATEFPDLELYHPWDIDIEGALEMALECEAAARDYDPRITNSEGATLNTGGAVGVYGNTHGFVHGYPSSRHSLSCSVIAQQGESMQRDYWYTSARSAAALDAAVDIGERAAQRAIARLDGRKLKTRQAPVLFRAEIAAGLLGSLVHAISGSALYRRATFLLDALDTPIFPDWVNIEENPFVMQGLSSAAFDAEGVATSRRKLVSEGILKGYVLGSYSARKLDLQTTGNAGGVRNLSIQMGELDFDALLKTMHTGLVVTELMGQGVNAITGDYSRGASGFWVENGEIQYPVEEITIAGNLKTMFQQLQAVGNDDDYPGSTRTGSWLIESMMIAGE
ncbi:MAG: metalloprotease PmbA [Pseudomonadota bacterium]|nr:metalloprotease PmbA [Pseudomonadota bacterium]